MPEDKLLHAELTRAIIGAAMEVHNYLKVTHLRVGLVINFAGRRLEYTRRVL